MALPPSRRDTIGPPPRNVSDLAAIVRHHGSYLRSLDPGILGGRWRTPRPVDGLGTQLVGGDTGLGCELVGVEPERKPPIVIALGLVGRV